MAAALSTRTWADTPRRYALLYPDIPEPERGVFRLIREGIVASIAKSHGTLLEHALSPASTATTVADILTGSTADVLITLGRIATSLTQQLQPQLPWITGATEMAVPTPGIGGISLVVSPDRVMDTLREVAPSIRRISVVLSPQRFGWLRPHMERAARSLCGFSSKVSMSLPIHCPGLLRTPGQTISSCFRMYSRMSVKAHSLRCT